MNYRAPPPHPLIGGGAKGGTLENTTYIFSPTSRPKAPLSGGRGTTPPPPASLLAGARSRYCKLYTLLRQGGVPELSSSWIFQSRNLKKIKKIKKIEKNEFLKTV